VNAYLQAMRRYATFTGRTTRSDFWIFTLVLLATLMFAAVLDGAFGTASSKSGLLFGLAGLVHTLPQLAANVRRLHDADRSGWWMLLWLTGVGGIVVFVLLCLPGTQGPNSFGPSPVALASGQQGSARFTPTSAQVAPPVSSSADLISKIERLSQLRSNGSLTDAEFESAKLRLLSREA
jgi:uncharacterized membrane protein YhaH (DUF805 family)